MRTTSIGRAAARLAALLALLGPSGCGPRLETSYGRIRSSSVNGVGAFAAMLEAQGHEVRSAARLTEELADWAEVIVRFAPEPGPPPKDEAAWYKQWLNDYDGGALLYVPRDYLATREYWERVRDELPANADPRLRERVNEALGDVQNEYPPTPPPATAPTPPPATAPKGQGSPKPKSASPVDWFEIEPGNGPPQVCQKLEGPWAEDLGLDPKINKISRRGTIKAGVEAVLLKGDGLPLVVAWHRHNQSRVLVIANGSFLLNVPLADRGRWPLAQEVADWIAAEDYDEELNMAFDPRPKRVAFVEGLFPLAGMAESPSVLTLLKVEPFGWVVAQLVALGVAACLYRAPTLGRTRPSPPSGADRPVAHPEALGALLARSGQAREARILLENYRRWRHGPSRSSRTPTQSSTRIS